MSLKNKSFILSFFLLLLGCQVQKSDSDKFIDFLNNNHIPITHTYIVISEEHCMTCNSMYYDLTKSFLNDSNIIFIIDAEGGLLNTNIYENKQNVYWDREHKLLKNVKLLSTSGVIFFNKLKTKIDTIVEINPDNIEETIKQINLRRKSNYK